MSAKSTLDIIDLFDENSRKLTISDISQMLNVPKSSVYRHVRLLKERDLLREIDDGIYGLGYKFYKYYRILKMDSNLGSISEKHLEILTKEFNETSMLLAYSNYNAVSLATVNPTRKVKVASDPGEIVPLHAGGSSKALLAFLDESILKELYNENNIKKYTDKTITDLESMKTHLKSIKEKGFASSEGELYDGVIGYGVPVFDSNRHVVASLSLSGPTDRMKSLDENYLVKRLKEVAKDIENFI